MRKMFIFLTLLFMLGVPVCVNAEESAVKDNAEYTEQVEKSEKKGGVDAGKIAVSIGGGFFISLIGCFIYLQSNKTVAKAYNATQYIAGRPNIRISTDTFLYKTETRREKDTNNK